MVLLFRRLKICAKIDADIEGLKNTFPVVVWSNTEVFIFRYKIS